MKTKPFDLPGTPLRPGVRLLEANAGTGKTYAISALVCRLVVEEGLGISNILVVTFTEAATEELKDRVRKYLQKILASLQSNRPTDALSEVYLKLPANHRDQAIRRLRKAVGLFDEASIFTIHGFCHRVLLQYAFESNGLFEPQLVKDPRPLFLELSRDYWRRHFYRGDPFLAALIHCLDLHPKALIEEFLEITRLGNPRVIPAVSNERYVQALSALRKIWEDLSGSIQDNDRVVRILSNTAAFKKPLRDRLPEILQFLQRPWPKMPTGPSANILRHLTTGYLNDQLMKKAAKEGFDPSHPFFDRVEDW